MSKMPVKEKEQRDNDDDTEVLEYLAERQRRKVIGGETRRRTFYYAWCDMTETDEVCLKCLAIVVKGKCLHCTRVAERKAANLQKLIDRKAKGELPCQLAQIKLI